MKNLTVCSMFRILAACVGLAFVDQGAGAATFSVTPAVVSNTFNGPITLQIGGLPAGDTVVVRKFLDLNGNGAVDGGDLLVQQFNLTDGQAGMVIGGVTNFNVPGDLNVATGAITAALDFPSGDFMQNLVGHYLYTLSSPAGHFAPLTNQFAVTNFPFPQQITGSVFSNGTSLAVPNAVVLLFPAPRPGHNGPGGNPLAGLVANGAGGYAVALPPGTYVPMALSSNYVANYTASPVLSLAGGQTISTNLTLTTATASISGQIADANQAGLGLPGVLMPASGNGLIAFAFSDANGNFTVPVTAGQWSVGSFDSSLIIHGYVGWNNDINVNAGATGVTLDFPAATALFYGRVTDDRGNPLAGLDVGAWDNNNLYQADGYTDANGNYAVGVLGLGDADAWQVQISNDSSPKGFIFSQPDFDQNNGTNLDAGQAVLVNITALPATNQITGTVSDNNGNPIAGVGVWANATIGGVDFAPYVDTDARGNYSFNVGGGTWTIGVSTGGGGDSLPADDLAPANQTVVISNNNAVVNFTTILATNTITGTLQDDHGTPLVGVGVWANATINGVNYNQSSANTDGNGQYSINVLNGIWTVNVSSGGDGNPLPGDELCPPNQTVVISNDNAVVNFTALLATNTITGKVSDSDGNPIAGAGVWANATIGGVNYSQYEDTDANGNYLLNVANGVWSVSLNCGSGGDGLQNLGDYQCPNSQTLTIANNDGRADFTVQICNGVQILTPSLPVGQVNVYYDQFLQASSCNGNFTWSLISGAQPPGLIINPDTGEISGTPTSVGTYTFTAQVTDGGGLTATQFLSLTILSSSVAPLQVTTASLTNATQNAAYKTTLLASGGVPPYSWSLAPGSANLPSGMSLSTHGVISGTPIASGTASFIVLVTDATTNSSFQILSLTVNPSTLPPVIVLTVPAQSDAGNFEFTFKIGADQIYTVQTSTNLTTWTDYETFDFSNSVPVSGGRWTVAIPNPAGASACFYRVKVGP